MKHRHLTDDAYTLAAIDDVIERGGRYDWAALRDTARADQGILHKISRVCEARKEDVYAQRHYLWSLYVQRHLA